MESLTLAITLLLVMDPLGNIPALIGLLESVAPERRRKVIFRECLIALGLLLVFLVVGPQLMGLLGLDQYALSIAGGVVLMLIALRLLFPSPGGVMGGGDPIEGEPLIVPIATPLIAGPSAIATVVLIHGTSDRWFSTGLLAVGIAWAVTTVVMVLSPEVIKLLGKRVLCAAERLTGLLVTVIAVQMILAGVKMFIAQL